MKAIAVILLAASLGGCAAYEASKPKLLRALHAACDDLPEFEAALAAGERLVGHEEETPAEE